MRKAHINFIVMGLIELMCLNEIKSRSRSFSFLLAVVFTASQKCSLPEWEESHNIRRWTFSIKIYLFLRLFLFVCLCVCLNFCDKSQLGINLYKWMFQFMYSYQCMTFIFNCIAHQKNWCCLSVLLSTLH